jgi:foldase protein PrsA
MSEIRSLRFRNQWVLLFVGILMISLIMSGCSKSSNEDSSGNDPKEVVLTYEKGEKITRGEFNTFISVNKMLSPQMAQYFDDPSFQQEMLTQYASYIILSKRISSELKKTTDKEIATQMKQLEDYFSQQEGGLEKQLTEFKIKKSDIEELIKLNYYSMKYLEALITNPEIEQQYKNGIEEKKYHIATVSHILISLTDSATNKEIRTDEQALARANEVLAKLKAGGDFVKLASEYSDDPGSKDSGGKYENADVSNWVPEFKQASLDLPLNTISDPPVKSDYGYHVMKVESRNVKTLDEVKDEVKNAVLEQKYKEFYEKELPGLITNKLATPQPSAQPTAQPSAQPTAQPSTQSNK